MSAGSPVTVVVPVYGAADDVRRCVESLLDCTSEPHALVLIDDASPGAAIGEYFAELRSRGLPHLRLLRNDRNLGFTGTANRGFSCAAGDVVLLNSDTMVTKGWLDALVRCVGSDARIGTATPFSNNAEILSFPRFCENNRWPSGVDPEPVRAAIAAAAVPTYPELPTGVGFCLYVRRALLDAIGPFDEAFGRGYGEENDLCMRAIAAGWRNVLCDDAFVLHTGERSFAGERAELVARHMQVLLGRHPDYMDLVRSFIAADPLEALRDAARVRLGVDAGPARGVMHVVPAECDGVRARAESSIAAEALDARHVLAVQTPTGWRLEFAVGDGGHPVARLDAQPGESASQLVAGIRATFRLDEVRWHGESGMPSVLEQAFAGNRDPSGGTGANAAFPKARVRDAFGYRPWTIEGARAAIARAAPAEASGPSTGAPAPVAAEPLPAASAAPTVPKGLARAVGCLHRTALGRAAARLVPRGLRDALRTRLR